MLYYILSLINGAALRAYAADGILPTPTNKSVIPSVIPTAAFDAVGANSFQAKISEIFFGTNSSIGQQIINALFAIAGVAAIIYIIWGGILYITSNGVPDKVKAARARIVSAAIGVILVVSTYALIRVGVGAGRLIDNTSRGNLGTQILPTN